MLMLLLMLTSVVMLMCGGRPAGHDFVSSHDVVVVHVFDAGK
ncbi:hypothetical protein [Neoaquamicrobium sediminum]